VTLVLPKKRGAPSPSKKGKTSIMRAEQQKVTFTAERSEAFFRKEMQIKTLNIFLK